jgi:glycosyltransferase involved in cell wall biosynthesis
MPKNYNYNTMPKVSVIIPTYNRAEFLRNSVSSVLEQTFKDFELIISDDASSDKTKEYVEGLSDPRVRYICNETNQGVAAARNNAFTISKGRYIAFLDDDDQWLPGKLEKQLRIIEKSPGSVRGVYTGVFTIDLDSNKRTSVSVPKYRGNILNEILPENFLITSSILLDKVCIEKVGLFDTKFKSTSDFDMWLRIAEEFEFDYVPEPLVRRFIHKIRITANYEAVISGLELLMSKHNKLFSTNKKAYSEYKLRLGIFYCYNGNTRQGRRVFMQAIKLYPFNIKHYYNFALSILGTRAFMKIKNYRSNVLYAIRGLNYEK